MKKNYLKEIEARVEIQAALPFRVLVKLGMEAFQKFQQKLKPKTSSWAKGVGTLFFTDEELAKKAQKELPKEAKPTLLRKDQKDPSEFTQQRLSFAKTVGD